MKSKLQQFIKDAICQSRSDLSDASDAHDIWSIENFIDRGESLLRELNRDSDLTTPEGVLKELKRRVEMRKEESQEEIDGLPDNNDMPYYAGQLDAYDNVLLRDIEILEKELK